MHVPEHEPRTPLTNQPTNQPTNLPTYQQYFTHLHFWSSIKPDDQSHQPPILSRAYCFSYADRERTLRNLDGILERRRRPLTPDKDQQLFAHTNPARDFRREAAVEHLREEFNLFAKQHIDVFRFCSNCTDLNEYIETRRSGGVS